MHGYDGHSFPHFVLSSCCKMCLKFYWSACCEAGCVLLSKLGQSTTCVCVWRLKIFFVAVSAYGIHGMDTL